MKEWIPIPGSNKDRLLQAALEEFSHKGFKEVNIAKLAQKADMTTGAVYHHFGSKLGLYRVLRTEMEQRILDRMEGAASLFEDPIKKLEAAMITGFESAVKLNASKLISEDVEGVEQDKIKDFITELTYQSIPGLEYILISSWRSLLKAVFEDHLSVEQGKQLMKWLFERNVIPNEKV
ncbi:MAG: helix-turn-helix transcriptional regulator [Bacillaceae bacterium]|nr:helix-turn-helix transcriptional regulator [Bacillaceae bacterium]